MKEPGERPVQWQDELNDLLRRNGVTQFAYVPDAGHRILSTVRSPIPQRSPLR